jgi:hypothetical protein
LLGDECGLWSVHEGVDAEAADQRRGDDPFDFRIQHGKQQPDPDEGACDASAIDGATTIAVRENAGDQDQDCIARSANGQRGDRERA